MSPPRSLRSILWDGWGVIHGALVLVLLGMGVIFLAPTPTFATSLSYRVFAEMGTEVTWGFACLLVGGIGALGLFWPSRAQVSASAFALSGMHVLIAVLSYLGNPNGVAWLLYAIFASMAVGRLLRGKV